MTDQAKKKIFAFINGRQGRHDLVVVAISEEGEMLAHHTSSTANHAKHDIGVTSTWKHDIYNAKYGPTGYDLEWVDDPTNDERVKAAMAKREAAKADAEQASKP